MVFRLYSQVFEDRVGPETLHVILSTLSASDRRPSVSCPLIPSSLFVHGGWGSVDRILSQSECFPASLASRAMLTRSTRCCYCLIADEKVQVLSATFRVKVAGRASTTSQEGRFVCNSRTAGT